ncbi:MAG: acyltransferase [Kiritimatiellia bacterium]|jgi:acetyltransferase-like isoleucine patch superfamily enzyme|nr:acyltransferase [Kiritimatiellia bacterium]
MRLSERWNKVWNNLVERILLRLVSERVMQSLIWRHRDTLDALIERNRRDRPVVYGSQNRLHVDATAVVNNALFNTLGGDIHVGPHAFFGPEVCLLTGTHDMQKRDTERQESGGGRSGRDIVVGRGVWLAARAMVIGPAIIGDHAVVGAGAVVTGDVEPGAFYAGVPARKIRDIEWPESVDQKERDQGLETGDWRRET